MDGRDASPALRWRGSWGAEPEGDGWRFALWAPSAGMVELDLAGHRLPMERGEDGFWTARAEAADDSPYGFVIDGELRPDPASRVQASADLHGPSRLHRPEAFDWPEWQGRPWEESVILEIHIGSFTPEGTFAAAAERMAGLAEMGFTAIEIMPVSHFPGKFNWGYDGVLLGALHPHYGTPDDFRRLIATAQEHGISVILDLVLNHFGPEGNYLHDYAPEFYNDDPTPWGHGIDYVKKPVRDYMIDVTLRWITEYRLDGLRLDAVHAIRDASDQHLLNELIGTIRAQDWGRPIHMITEDERNIPDLIEAGYTAQWNDDWHHVVFVLITGRGGGFLDDYNHDTLDDLHLALAYGQVRQGQEAPLKISPIGAPCDHLPWSSFINHNTTHDQIGNSPTGARLIDMASPGHAQFLHALLAFLPFTPMYFMGEEAGSHAPFPFFCDYEGEMKDAVRKGRREELDGLGYKGQDMVDPLGEGVLALACPETHLPDDTDAWQDLTRECLRLRRDKLLPLLMTRKTDVGHIRALGERSLEVRWAFEGGTYGIRLNFGAQTSAASEWTEGELVYRFGDLDRQAYAFEVRLL